MKKSIKRGKEPQGKKLGKKQNPKELKIDIQPDYDNKTNKNTIKELENLKKINVDTIDLNSEETLEKAKKLVSNFNENSIEADLDEIATLLAIYVYKGLQEKFGSDYDFELYGKTDGYRV